MISNTIKISQEDQDRDSQPNTNVLLCYILMISGDPDFRLSSKTARSEGKEALYLPEGWIYKRKEDAEQIANRYTFGKRVIMVRPWFNVLAHDVWYGTKEQAAIARKKISQDIRRHTNNKDRQKIEIECDMSGLHHSWLHRDSLPKDMSEKECQIHDYYKQLWTKALEEETDIKFRDQDIQLMEEDIEKDEIPLYVTQINQKHAVLHHKRTYILTEKKDPALNRNTFSLEPIDSFHNWYKPNKDKDGNSLSKKWLEHPNRRQYDGGIVFDPYRKGHYEGYYNLFQGFKVIPKPGDCSIFWQLTKEALSAGNEEVYTYIRKWLAHMIQYPWELPEVALAFRGLQGTGKGTFMRYVGELINPYYLELAQTSQVTGRFNSHLKDLILVYANEALWGGNKTEVGALKAMITDKFQAIEQKGVDILQVRNCKRIVLSSNEDWIAPLDIDDRRFLVVDINPKFKEDKVFFRDLFLQMENGGLEALMYDLINENISDGWHPRKKPYSGNGFDLKLRGMKTPHLWLYECLDAKKYILDDDGKSIWSPNNQPRKEQVYKDYEKFCVMKGRQPEDSRIFWKAVKQIIDNLEESRSHREEGRFRYINFPSILDARVAFCKFAKEDESIWSV